MRAMTITIITNECLYLGEAQEQRNGTGQEGTEEHNEHE